MRDERRGDGDLDGGERGDRAGAALDPQLEHGRADDVGVGGAEEDRRRVLLEHGDEGQDHRAGECRGEQRPRTQMKVLTQSAPGDPGGVVELRADLHDRRGDRAERAGQGAQPERDDQRAQRALEERRRARRARRRRPRRSPMPMMMPGIACGASARYSTARRNRKVERRATMTARTASTLTRTAADTGDDQAVPDRLDVGRRSGRCARSSPWSGSRNGIAQRREDQGERPEDQPADGQQGPEDHVEGDGDDADPLHPAEVQPARAGGLAAHRDEPLRVLEQLGLQRRPGRR